MKFINGTLYLEIKDAVFCGFGTPEYLAKEKSRGAKWAVFIKDPVGKKSKVLIEYETLAEDKKEKVITRYGNPYDHFAKEPIKNLVSKDLAAHKFYVEYEYGDDKKKLPIKNVDAYTNAASWLNMLVKAEADKKEIKQLLNLTITQFWVKVCEILTAEKIDLPSNIIRLRQKVDQYKTDGYPCLINKLFGKKNAKKVNTEIAEALLLEMISNHNQLDDVYVCYQYNKWAVDNGHKQITPRTVANYRANNEPDIIITREGNNAFNEKFIKQQKGFRPSQPGYLWEHDDNNLDFLFTDGKYDYHRYVCIAVTDSSCDLILGKSYIVSQQPKPWMIQAAYIDAMYYIRSLTGGWYLPFEVKADNWNKKELVPFYEKIANYVPPAVGNKHRGYIEQFFRSSLWKRMQKVTATTNYNGNNMTAKNRGVNMEVLEGYNKKFRPMIGNESEQLIENFFLRLRTFPDITRENMNALSKEQQWLEKWHKMPIEKRRPITDEQFLLTFGVEHNPARQITVTNRGIEPQINGVKYSFDIPASVDMLSIIGSKVNVIYDPYDMSRVLITNHQDIRFVATEATLQPRALQDTYIGSRTFLNALIAEKKQQVHDTAGRMDGRRSTIDQYDLDAEAILQAGALSKELKNRAEMAYLPISSSNKNTTGAYDPLDNM